MARGRSQIRLSTGEDLFVFGDPGEVIHALRAEGGELAPLDLTEDGREKVWVNPSQILRVLAEPPEPHGG